MGCVNSDYLADGRLATRTPQGQVRVTETLNVHGHEHVYAIGDITDLAEAKMAGYAMQHAEVVARNIAAQPRGERPTATYRPAADRMILLPLGPRRGVGQLPTPDGPAVVPTTTVVEYKGRNLFTSRFAELFGTA
jgi:apoptosis-inducing factor 2